MTWFKWLPWRYVVRYAAHKHGFIDPVALLVRLHNFAQPSEVGEPIELLRAGVVFHARGLINSRVIQHNLDWVWPYWVERQFDPYDNSFIPRAFSITHINLTHRNWTAIGYPDCAELPIVDPRGLLTPFLDGWSLDGWIMPEHGECLLPSRSDNCQQQYKVAGDVRIDTTISQPGMTLHSRASVELEGGVPVAKLRLRATSDQPGYLVLALRPQNPEGVSFIHKVALNKQADQWLVDNDKRIMFSRPADRHHVSTYQQGDVYIHLNDAQQQAEGGCDVGMVTAAALFKLSANDWQELVVTIPLTAASQPELPADAWRLEQQKLCKLVCPEPLYQFLYDAATTSLILHSPQDVYPGPYTYRRFWFRDAAFIIHALLCVGLTERAARALQQFPGRQTLLGYFCSQEGEWDANGEVLWILKRYAELSGRELSPDWHGPLKKGASWIIKKRLSASLDTPHAGLLPAGFSAEHLGPNDFYYWDDFWGVAGLQAAAELFKTVKPKLQREFSAAAHDFTVAIENSLMHCAARLKRPAMPASPYRRLDAGAIGSLAIGYPAQLCAADDPRLLDTVEFLLQRCFVKGAFYQDMIHSGLNAYLTLHVAQVLLRANDPRYLELMDAVAALASPTGQWPEAIHPATGGGCMGDGHHVWAAAEWVLMLRHCFVREENERLVLCAGVPGRWLASAQDIRFGPAPTSFGSITLVIRAGPGQQTVVDWQADWHQQVGPQLEISLPGHSSITIATTAATGSATLSTTES
ncbi:hypothetical protein WG68_14735 [Arsukibacterium ikkense]|uniref:Uncharacterized protein n=1 Tax=Arsukibacterium ikkense TaxID=336831 RepID=A0A0M2V5V5_9GAMM|nr:hypothetical protein [Arsukibacterium ikkense]KKO44553.1 hypothetical protein WG68_14735 [Arsukibacterium ikkense]